MRSIQKFGDFAKDEFSKFKDATVRVFRKSSNASSTTSSFDDSGESIPSIRRNYGTIPEIRMMNESCQESSPPQYQEHIPLLPTAPSGDNNFNKKNGPYRKLSGPINGIPLSYINYNYLNVDPLTNNNGNKEHHPPLSPSPSSPGFTSSFDFHSTNNPEFGTPEKFSVGRYIKIFIITIVFFAIAILITMTSENIVDYKQLSLSKNNPLYIPLLPFSGVINNFPLLTTYVKGPFFSIEKPSLKKSYNNKLSISIEKTNFHPSYFDEDMESIEKSELKNKFEAVIDPWELGIYEQGSVASFSENSFSHSFDMDPYNLKNGSYFLVFRTNTNFSYPFAISTNFIAQVAQNGVIFGAMVIVGLYILIIFELLNRTLSALVAASAAIGILSLINERPTTEEMVSWLDMETLILLFSMMVIVSIFCETGFFDYSAYIMYKIANGQVWPLITGLCLFTAVVSAFLDNVTTILLMTPVTIRICEAIGLNPVPVLISTVIFSNIGGASTPVGDPPNVIIANNPNVIREGVDFAQFSLHMLLGIIPVTIVAYIQIRFIFRDMKSLQFTEPYVVKELQREIDVWTRTANSMSSYSKEESQVRSLLLSKVSHLKNKLKLKISMGGQSEENYKSNLAELKATCQIRDWPLLIKCGVVLGIVIILFFLHSVPQLNLSLGWTSLLGALFLLILADRRELEGIFSRVEWSTLIFFSALFIVMEGVSRLGLLEFIGNQTEQIILNVHPDSRLTVAILLILWVSGIVSAFIDNIPFTTMMIQIVVRLAERISLPLKPLIWALSFGACLGGNGTIIGASSNVVCAGLADQHGYRFTFVEYFKIGFPVMILNLVVTTVYLLICHTWLEWNY